MEDKDSLRTMLRHALEGQGYAVIEARDESEARAALGQSLPSVVLSDLRLPDGDGFGVLRAAKDADPDLPVIVMTAYGSIQDAVAAMKDGALDFLAKPVDPDHLLLMVERALAQRRLLSEYNLLKEEAAKRRGMPEIIGESAVIRHTLQSVQRAAGSDTTVLLEGESGTGKELFARALHALSERVAAPFIAINCAAIPESLLEAELFGYEKGAFTGAAQRKPGRFELAQRGTLFLDEVGELPMPLQAKILRAIETSASSAWAARPPFRWTSGWWRRPIAACGRRWPIVSSGRTSTSASRCSRSRFRRCAIVPRTFRSSRGISSSAPVSRWAAR